MTSRKTAPSVESAEKSLAVPPRAAGKPGVETEIAAWERQRNDSAARIKWRFTTEKARSKMSRAYPKPKTMLDDQSNES